MTTTVQADAELSNRWNAEMDRLCDASIDAVAATLGRALSPIERQIARTLFWVRVGATDGGEWIDLEGDGSSLRLVLEPAFRAGFIALASRVLAGRRRPVLYPVWPARA